MIQPLDEEAIFKVAVEIAAEDSRDTYLQQVCGDNPALLNRVLLLLRARDEAPGFLESPSSDPLVMANSAPTPLGTQIGPYKLREQIGEGGFATVYVAEQQRPVARKVALKIVKLGLDTKQIVARFDAERQAMAMMDHPNIAKVFDAGTTDSGRPYFVMELVHGLPITEFCDEHQMPNARRLQLFVDVCRAIQHAHQKGVIHRDLKPTNIMVTMHDDKSVPKVIDFGIAKALRRKLTDQSIYTAYGQLVGTPLYMSPEQAQMSDLDVDTRSDVYSLGVLLYELLTGVTPFEEEKLKQAAFDEMRRIIREDEPPRPSARVSTLGDELLTTVCDRRRIDRRALASSFRRELDWIVMKSLAKNRNLRYESAGAFADDVTRYLQGAPVLAYPPSVGYQLRKLARRNRVAISFAALMFLFLMLFAAGMGWTAREHTARRVRVAEQVELSLEDARRLEREQNWPEALAAAKRAQSALAAEAASEDLQASVDQVVSDLKLIERLEEIRVLRSEIQDQDFRYAETDQDYAAALREHGVDVDTLATDEAANKLRSRTDVLPALIAALDDWAACRQSVEDEAGATTVARLIEVLDTDPWRKRVRQALAANDMRELEELAGAEDVVQQAPATANVLAGALEYHGRPDLAIQILERAAAKHPDDFWLHFNLAAAYSSASPRRLEDAIRHYTAARALRPNNAVANYNLGVVLEALGNSDGATACYRRTIELDPTYAKAHTNLGNLLKEEGQLDEAMACYRRAIEYASTNTQPHIAHNNLGVMLQQRGQVDEAMACYRRAIELDPEYPDAHMKLGILLQSQGNLDEAVRCFRRAAQCPPERAIAHSYAGGCLFAQGKVKEAIACLQRAAELEPNDAKHHYNLGIALNADGDSERAVACYRQAIELNPDLAPIYNNLADTLATASERKVYDPAEALEMARKAVHLDAEPWVFWDTLSVAAYRAGDWKTALDARQEKLKRHALTTEDRLFLAMTHWQLGNQLEARKWYVETTIEVSDTESTSTRLRNLRDEARQLLGVTTSPAEAEDSDD